MHDRVSNGLHQVSMAVGVSQPVIDQLIQDGMSHEHTRVIANGIDTEAFMSQPVLNLAEEFETGTDDFVIATTGSLIRRKGIDIIIDVIPHLKQDGIPAKLIIIGDGPERRNLQQQSVRLGVSESILFLGERDDVPGLLRGSVDLYVSAAREEAFGLALAEASLAELAVIAPDTGGIKNVIIDGVTGKLHPAGDTSKLCDDIIDLYRSPSLRDRMGKAGRQHIQNNLTIKHNVERFQQLYCMMINDPAMHMKWLSHWQLRGSFKSLLRELLDRTRAKVFRTANIFISTSRNEPFGLSILEAMAAGHCIVLPADGAYWDKTLDDSVNCIKYRPEDADDLANKIMHLCNNMDKVKTLDLAGMKVAENYRAESCYKPIIESITGRTTDSRLEPSHSIDGEITP